MAKKIIVIIGENEMLKWEVFFRYKAEHPKNITYVNPENDKHPRQQCIIIEEIAIEFNKYDEDVIDTVIISTNSPYIVDHMENMMRAFRCGIDVSDMFFLKNPGCFINPELIEVVLCDGTEPKSEFEQNGRINWSTFSDISDLITDIYFDIPYPPGDDDPDEDDEE